MIKNIELLRKKSPDFIRKFFSGCTVEEKIDTYYVCVEIASKNNVFFKKSSGKVIDRSDLIVNEMWQRFVNDWKHLQLVNDDWFEEHIGYKFHMFYFPCSKPILTQYPDNISYIIDRVEFNNVIVEDAESVFSGMNMVDKFNIAFKHLLVKKDDISEPVDGFISGSGELSEYAKGIIDFDKSVIFATEKPEGFIFKYGKKHIYQTCSNDDARVASAEKTQYEYLLVNFTKFWNSDESVVDCLNQSYTKSVCNLFNKFIAKEKETKEIENNIDASSLESPCVGKRFDICYVNIPDEQSVALCKESELYKNIFKILLINLKRTKDMEHSIMFTKKNIEDWNMIVRTIQNVCV